MQKIDLSTSKYGEKTLFVGNFPYVRDIFLNRAVTSRKEADETNNDLLNSTLCEWGFPSYEEGTPYTRGEGLYIELGKRN